jgi:hypothetical protein
MNDRIVKGVDDYCRYTQRMVGASLTRTEQNHLTSVLSEVDEFWTVVAGEHGVRLAFNEWGTEVEPRSRLTVEKLADLAQAVTILAKAGMHVTVGRSARGVSFLNVNHD